ncbi:MAG TPA: RNA polymerase sigma factor [Thermoanaerobaculia bacterium]|nr:RNA polymerase sigma factor [Thermoanaerobaculia bacterium]
MIEEDGKDDDELVRLMVAYQAGELVAFEGLYERLAAELRRYFHATGADGAAQDLVQETFLAIHRSRRTYQPPLPVRPWVFGIARNALGRHRRDMWRRSRHEDREARPAEEVAAPAAALALEPRDLAAALARLPAGRREAWMLHHVHGLSFQQIAARFRIGVGAAKLRSSRAMRALRVALGVEAGGAPDG